MGKSILIIGSGGREHAIAWKLRQHGHEAALKAGTVDELVQYAREHNSYLTIVGPDNYLADGIVDRFQSEGLKIFGPTRAAAQIEASKAFAKDLMREHGIPTATFRVFRDFESAREYARERLAGSRSDALGSRAERLVIKASGLALGKGVTIVHGIEEAEQALERIFVKKVFGHAGDEVVIEEYLDGPEVSVHAFCDGKTFRLFPSARDHKTIFERNRGPNTGGMGTIAPVVDIDVSDIVSKVVKKLHYTGILYPGLKITPAGPKVLEFNARFGDPETQSYMRLLKTDLLEIVEHCIAGSLDEIEIEWYPGFACCIVMASAGYPGAYEKGYPITGIEDAEKMPSVVVFSGGMTDGKTSGGRVLGVSATGATLEEALDRAYAGVEKIDFHGKHYRKDIGQ